MPTHMGQNDRKNGQVTLHREPGSPKGNRAKEPDSLKGRKGKDNLRDWPLDVAAVDQQAVDPWPSSSDSVKSRDSTERQDGEETYRIRKRPSRRTVGRRDRCRIQFSIKLGRFKLPGKGPAPREQQDKECQ